MSSQFGDQIKTLPRGGVLPEIEIQFFIKDDAPANCIMVEGTAMCAYVLMYGDCSACGFADKAELMLQLLSQAVHNAAVIHTPHVDAKAYPDHVWRWDLAGKLPMSALQPVDGHRPTQAVRYVRYGLRNTQSRHDVAERSTSPA